MVIYPGKHLICDENTSFISESTDDDDDESKPKANGFFRNMVPIVIIPSVIIGFYWLSKKDHTPAPSTTAQSQNPSPQIKEESNNPNPPVVNTNNNPSPVNKLYQNNLKTKNMNIKEVIDSIKDMDNLDGKDLCLMYLNRYFFHGLIDLYMALDPYSQDGESDKQKKATNIVPGRNILINVFGDHVLGDLDALSSCNINLYNHKNAINDSENIIPWIKKSNKYKHSLEACFLVRQPQRQHKNRNTNGVNVFQGYVAKNQWNHDDYKLAKFQSTEQIIRGKSLTGQSEVIDQVMYQIQDLQQKLQDDDSGTDKNIKDTINKLCTTQEWIDYVTDSKKVLNQVITQFNGNKKPMSNSNEDGKYGTQLSDFIEEVDIQSITTLYGDIERNVLNKVDEMTTKVNTAMLNLVKIFIYEIITLGGAEDPQIADFIRQKKEENLNIFSELEQYIDYGSKLNVTYYKYPYFLSQYLKKISNIHENYKKKIALGNGTKNKDAFIAMFTSNNEGQ